MCYGNIPWILCRLPFVYFLQNTGKCSAAGLNVCFNFAVLILCNAVLFVPIYVMADIE